MILFSKPYFNSDEINIVIVSIKSNWFTRGIYNQKFESSIKKFTKSKYVFTTSSCTSTIYSVLKYLNLNEKDEVITSPLTFISTITNILHTKAKLVLSDVCYTSGNLDPEKIIKKINKNTKVIIFTHYGGNSKHFDKISKISKKNKIKLIEDSAHAFGAKYELDYKYVGHNSFASCFSFYANKTISTFEGGCLCTNNKKLYEYVKSISNCGIIQNKIDKNIKWDYDVNKVGYKFNMNNIQASYGLMQMKKLDEILEKRRIIANRYKNELIKMENISIDHECKIHLSSNHLFVIKLNKSSIRRRLIEYLKKNKIYCSIHYINIFDLSISKYFKKYYEELPNYRKFVGNCISLPIYPGLSLKNQKYVINNVKQFFK